MPTFASSPVARSSTTSTEPSADAPGVGRAVAAASVGNALEWFDFSSYAFFATFIAANFFHDGDSASGLLATFLVFGVGFLARPLGAVVLGAYGDTHGRKAALTTTIALMAAGTFVIAVAPPLAVLGVGAPLLLCLGRLLQGFSAGGEIGGAAAYLVEAAPVSRRASLASWLQASMGLSNLLSALIGFAVTSVFTADQVTDWAWRIPFVVGLLIVPVGLYIRRSLPETNAFLAIEQAEQQVADVEGQPRRSPLRSVVRDHPRHLVVGALVCILWNVSTYALIIYSTAYYTSASGGLRFTAHDAFLANVVGNIAMVAACLGAGRLADRIGAARSLRLGIAILLLVPLPMLVVLHAVPTLPVLVVTQVVLCTCAASFVGVVPSVLPRMYPVAVRSTGLAVSYNIAAIFFAGFTPALMTWATRYSVYAPAVYVALCALVGAATLPVMLRLVREQEQHEAQTRTPHAAAAPLAAV